MSALASVGHHQSTVTIASVFCSIVTSSPGTTLHLAQEVM